MNSYKSSPSLEDINIDIREVQKSMRAFDTQKRLNKLVKSPRNDPALERIKSIEFSLPKISRLNLSKASLDISKISSNPSGESTNKLKKSYGQIYKNLFNPHKKPFAYKSGVLKDLKDLKSPISPRETKPQAAIKASEEPSVLNKAILAQEAEREIPEKVLEGE